MIDSVFTFYTDVMFETPCARLCVASSTRHVHRLLAHPQQNVPQPPVAQFLVVEVDREARLLQNALGLDKTSLQKFSSVVAISVSTHVANQRHAVQTIASASSSATSVQSDSQAALTASLMQELNNCPVALRTGQQVAAFFLLRCNLYMTPSDLGTLALHVSHLGDQSTLSALVPHILGLHDAVPKQFASNATTALPYRLSSVRTLRDTPTGAPKDTISLTIEGVGVPASRPIRCVVVCTRSNAMHSALPLSLPPAPLLSNNGRQVVRDAAHAAGPSSVRVAADMIIQQLRATDAIAVVSGARYLVDPCRRQDAQYNDELVPSIGVIDHDKEVELSWSLVVRALQDWMSSSCAGDGPDSCDALVIHVDDAAHPSDAAELSAFSAPNFLSRHPLLFGVTCHTMLLPAGLVLASDSTQSLAVGPRPPAHHNLFAEAVEGSGTFSFPTSLPQLSACIAHVLRRQRSLCLRRVMSLFVTGDAATDPSIHSQAIAATSCTYGARDLPRARARQLIHGGVATNQAVHGLYELSASPLPAQSALHKGSIIVFLWRASEYGGGVDVRVAFPTRIATVTDAGATSLCESWWRATSALRNLLLLPRPPTVGIDAAWSAVKHGIVAHAPQLVDRISERLQHAMSLHEIECILLSELSMMYAPISIAGTDDVDALPKVGDELPKQSLVGGGQRRHAHHRSSAVEDDDDGVVNSRYFTGSLACITDGGSGADERGHGMPNISSIPLADVSSMVAERLNLGAAPLLTDITNRGGIAAAVDSKKSTQRHQRQNVSVSNVAVRDSGHGLQLEPKASQSVAPSTMHVGQLRSDVRPDDDGMSRSQRSMVRGTLRRTLHNDPSNDHSSISSASTEDDDDEPQKVHYSNGGQPVAAPQRIPLRAEAHQLHRSDPSRVHMERQQVPTAKRGPAQRPDTELRHQQQDDDDDDDIVGLVSSTRVSHNSNVHTVASSLSAAHPVASAAFFNESRKEHVLADPRWVRLISPHDAKDHLSSLVPSASSLESAIVRHLPGGSVSHKSFSLSLASLQSGTAYIEFPVLRSLLKQQVTLAARSLILCRVLSSSRHLDIVKAVKLPLFVTGTQAPVEHVFYGLERGASYCIIHIASTKDPAEWISFDDIVVADGIEFSTPEFAVEQLRVTEVYARSVVMEWDGNAPGYIVTVQRLVDEMAPEDDEDTTMSGGGGHPSIATTFHSAGPQYQLTGLLPSTLYKVTVAPSMSTTNELFCESCEHIVATALEPSEGHLVVQAAALPPVTDHQSSGGVANAFGQIPEENRVGISLSYPPVTILQDAYVLTIEPSITVDGLSPNAPLSSSSTTFSDASSKAVVSAIPGRTVEVDVAFDVIVTNRTTNVTIMHKRSLLPLRTSVGPFDMMFSVAVTSVSSTTVDLAWFGTGDQFLVELSSDGDEDQCISVGRHVKCVTFDRLKPLTLYTATVKGKTSVNVVVTTFRTLPGKPHVGSVVGVHSAARRELIVTLPPRVRSGSECIDHKVVVHPLEQLLVGDSDEPLTVSLDVAVLQQVSGHQYHTSDGGLFVPLHLGVSQLLRSAGATNGVPLGAEDILESQTVTLAVVSDIRATAAANGCVEIRWSGLVHDPAVEDDNVHLSSRTSTTANNLFLYQVAFGPQMQSVSGRTCATFQLPITNDLFHTVKITGRHVVEELCPMLYILPPTPPSPSLFELTLYEDHATIIVSERINTMLDGIPADVKQYVTISLEFISQCFPIVRVALPVHALMRVHVPLMLNRSSSAFIEARVVVALNAAYHHLHLTGQHAASASHNGASSAVRSDVVQVDEPLFLNQVSESRAVSLATPMVHIISNVELVELESRRATLRWFSDNTSHDVHIFSGGAGTDRKAESHSTCHTVRPLVALEDLVPETCYRVRIVGKESGGHYGEVFFVTPPVLSITFVHEVASTVTLDANGALEFEIPETRRIPAPIAGGDGMIQTKTRVTLQHPTNPTQWSSVDGEITKCTAVLPPRRARSYSTVSGADRWPFLKLECCVECRGEEVQTLAGGSRVFTTPSSNAHEVQQHKIDLVGSVQIEEISWERCVISWMGSPSSFLLTYRTTAHSLDDCVDDTGSRIEEDESGGGPNARNNTSPPRGLLSAPTTIRKTACRHVFDFVSLPARSEILFFTLQGDEGASNTVHFSIICPPEPQHVKIRRYLPTCLTFALSRPKKSAFLVTGAFVVVDDVKHLHSGSSDVDEEFTVTLDSARTLFKKQQQQQSSDKSRIRQIDLPIHVVVTSHAAPRPILLPQTGTHQEHHLYRNAAAIETTFMMKSPVHNISELLARFPALNPHAETVTVTEMPLLHPLLSPNVRHVDINNADVQWVSSDVEFYVDIFQFLATPLRRSAEDDGEQPAEVSSVLDDTPSPVRRRDENSRSRTSPNGQLVPVNASTHPSGYISRSLVTTAPQLTLRQLQPGALHLVRIRGRQCGDVVLELAFLTQPLIPEKSIVLRRHAEPNTITVHVDAPCEEYRCAEGGALLFTTTVVSLVDSDGTIMESVKVDSTAQRPSVDSPGGSTGTARFALHAPETRVTVTRYLACEWEGKVIENNNLKTELTAARIPLSPVLSGIELRRIEPNQCFITWGGKDTERQGKASVLPNRYTIVATPVVSLHSGVVNTQQARRTAVATLPETVLASLCPATLYEVTVTTDVSCKMICNRNTRALVVHDDAPDVPSTTAFVVTPPVRRVGGTLQRYLGGATLSIDPTIVEHEASGVSLFQAVRVIPDNTIIVSKMPCRTDKVEGIPRPSLSVVNDAPVFVTAVPCGSSLSAEVALNEPAGSLTHRLEWFQIMEVSERSPFRVNTINPLQFSAAEVQPIEMMRVLRNPVISHVTSRRASIAWETSHDEMRCEVALQDLTRPELPAVVHRVVENEIALDSLTASTAYEVTVSPSYQNTPCEALQFVVLTAPKKPKAPKIHVLLLNAMFDLPASVRLSHVTSAQPHVPVVLTLTHTALVICTKEVSIVGCTTATDFLEKTQARNVFKSSDTEQRVDLRLRSGKSYALVFFTSVHHPMAVNGILHSKPCVVEHRTDCYAPTNLHVISRTKSSITVGWSSVDVGSKLLRFIVEMAPVAHRVSSGAAVSTATAGAAVGTTPRSGASDLLQVGRQPAMSVTMSQLFGTAPPEAGMSRAGRFKSLGLRQAVASTNPNRTPAEEEYLTPQQRLEMAFDDPSPGEPDQRQQLVVETSASRPEMHATFSFLTVGVQYVFRVRQAAGSSSPDAAAAVSGWSVMLVTETAAPPKPVERLQVLGVSSSTIRLGWVDAQSSDVDQMGYIVQWKTTERAPSGTAGLRVQELRVHTCHCEITGLSSGVQYKITVTPMNASGEVPTGDNATILVRTEAPQQWRL